MENLGIILLIGFGFLFLLTLILMIGSVIHMTLKWKKLKEEKKGEK